MKKRSVLIRVAVFVVLLAAVAVNGFRYYTSNYYTARDYKVQTEVLLETEDYIVYGDTDSDTGFIFYPGAKVEESAYAPILDELAETGICCVVVNVPFLYFSEILSVCGLTAGGKYCILNRKELETIYF